MSQVLLVVSSGEGESCETHCRRVELVFKEKWFPLDLGSTFAATSTWKIGATPDKLVGQFYLEDGSQLRDELVVKVQGKLFVATGKRTGVNSEGKPITADLTFKSLDDDMQVFQVTNVTDDGKPTSGFTIYSTRVKFTDVPAAK